MGLLIAFGVLVAVTTLGGEAAMGDEIYAVLYSRSQGSNAWCSGGGKGDSSAIERLPVTDTCIARHGAPAGRAYYTTVMDTATRQVVAVTYGCTDSSCTDCLVVRAGIGTCRSLGPEANATESIAFQTNSANFLPQNTSGAVTNGLSMLWYSDCGDPAALSTIDALGIVPTTSDASCTEIRPGFYHSLHHPSRNQTTTVSGNWWCTDAACSEGSCVLSLDAIVLGQSTYNTQGCFTVASSTRLGQHNGNQPACACTADHVYVNIYTSDNRNERSCTMGQPFETAIISKLTEGFHALSHAPAQLEINRVLKLGWDADRSRTMVTEYGAPCETAATCEENITNPQWSKCYTTTKTGGSTAIFPPNEVCYGSSELNYNGNYDGVVVYSFYGSANCPDNLAETNENGVVEIRGYGKADLKCHWDGTIGNTIRKSYYLEKNTTTGSANYTARFGCGNSTSCDPAGCQISLTDLAEGECRATAFGSIKIKPMSDMIACRVPAPPGPPGPPGGPTEEPDTRHPDFNHNSTVLIIGSCAGVLVLAMVVAGGVYYMRSQSRDRYESLVGSRRSRSRSRSSGPRGRSRGRPQDRNKYGTGREATYYDGV